MHRHTKNIVTAGTDLSQASSAMIMVHGRGANPHSILGVAEHLVVEGMALLAPAATANTWYPFSFMAPKANNEPGLSTGLALIGEIVQDVQTAGIPMEKLYFLGFSQGACLVSEFIGRNAQKYGGAFIYSGGLIGQELEIENYIGDFADTPILIGCSDVDAHVPLVRVQATTKQFQAMGAKVTERIYPNAPHTIFEDEIALTNAVLERREK